MPAVKKYTRINFQNYPSTSTPLNATNLNKLDKGIDDLDDEVVTVKNAIENMSFDADSISYDNTSSGLQATDVQDAVDEINDNLAGFKFYPSGTGIVGLISDDSAYTDANGKYVIWGTETAEQLVEDNPNTYKSVPSTEECRGKVGADTASPFNSLIDINSTKITATTSYENSRYLYLACGSSNLLDNTPGYASILPLSGYKKIAYQKASNSDLLKHRFLKKDGTKTELVQNYMGGDWTQYYDIPSDAEAIIFYFYHAGGVGTPQPVSYSLLK